MKVVRSEGFFALWRGITPAIVAGASTSALRCGVQDQANGFLARRMGVKNFDHLNLPTRAAAEAAGGFAAGVVLPLIVTPLELVKCRQQVAHASSGSRSGTWAVVRDVVRIEGLAGLYVGHGFTTLRSTLGNAALFGPYVVAKDGLGAALGPSSPLVLPLSGAIAGLCSWAVNFPIDSIKSRIQVAGSALAVQDTTRTGPGGMVDMRTLRVSEAFVQLWREGGVYRGITPVLLRAVPVHMCYLPVFDFMLSWLRENT
jgi:hypothetical protein